MPRRSNDNEIIFTNAKLPVNPELELHIDPTKDTAKDILFNSDEFKNTIFNTPLADDDLYRKSFFR